jgi:hypothetical protein
MCDPISALLLVGTIGASFGSAMLASGAAKAEAQIEQAQLKTEIENERIKAMSETNNRLEQFRKDEASNRAALSALGVADNISYIQGIAPANRRVVARDVRSIQFNAGQEIGRKKYEIAVAGYRAKANSRTAYMQAASDSIGAIGSSWVNRSGANQRYTPVNG